jgi:hypothetical protein
MTTVPVRRVPTADEIMARQFAEGDVRHRTATRGNAAMVAASAVNNLPAVASNQSSVTKYLDDVAPSSIVGRMIKFNKNGKFVTPDDDAEVSEEIDFICLADQTLIGWIRFYPDAPPDRIMGELYSGFIMPPRAELGDTDPAAWIDGISGKPEDPWRHQMLLVLQQAGTTELYTFVTQSATGRRSVGNLLRSYDRMRRVNPNELPVVRLKAGGFSHRDERIGWVATPAFAIVGRAPRDSVVTPDTSPGGDMNDDIPW